MNRQLTAPNGPHHLSAGANEARCSRLGACVGYAAFRWSGVCLSCFEKWPIVENSYLSWIWNTATPG